MVTPHPGEMSRLTGASTVEIQANRSGYALCSAAEWNTITVLKGAHTVVATPEGRAAVSPYANAGLASAGTGDVLAGVAAGLISQGLPPGRGGRARRLPSRRSRRAGARRSRGRRHDRRRSADRTPRGHPGPGVRGLARRRGDDWRISLAGSGPGTSPGCSAG